MIQPESTPSRRAFQRALTIFAVRNCLRSAFTLIEVMIALSLTLVMMLALTQAFKMIGDRIGESQSELQMSSNLRELATRLRLEIDDNRLTASPSSPPTNSDGYLSYVEGPMTSRTTAHLALAQPFNVENPDYVNRSRYGDLDDILAFTTTTRVTGGEATGEFMGYIPRGVLAAQIFRKGREVNPGSYTYRIASPGDYTPERALELVPFYSTDAEIIYWLSPRWQKSSGTGTLQYDAATGQPLYRDGDGDQLPDTMDLHRRVLLIRRDLNMRVEDINIANDPDGDLVTTTPPNPFPLAAGLLPGVEVLPFLYVDPSGANQRIVPISSLTGTEASPNPNFFSTGSADLDNTSVDNPDAPGRWANNANAITPNWLVGMARLHQVMDLSISRVTDRWSTPNDFDISALPGSISFTNPASFYGLPSRLVQANSLATLSRPENRFAAVRVPESIMSNSGLFASSMPQMALCPPHPFMVLGEHVQRDNDLTTQDFVTFDESNYLADVPANALASPGLVRDLISQADPDGAGNVFDATGSVTDSTTNPLTRYGRFTLTGFLRPEFNLQDRLANPFVGTSTPVTVFRGRSDVIASNVLSFDVKIFDSAAPAFVNMNGGAGVDGVDDDADNVTDEVDELGFIGSDDETIRMNDLNVRRAIASPLRCPSTPSSGGEFVDLGYGNLAGHPIGRTLGSPFSLVARGLNSNFSNVNEIIVSGSPAHTFSAALQQSGRFVLKRAGGSADLNSFYQNTFDTFTTDYLVGDDFDQEGRRFGTSIVQTDPGDPILGIPPTFGVQDFGTFPGNFSYTIQSDNADGSGDNSAIDVPATVRLWTNMNSPRDPTGTVSDLQPLLLQSDRRVIRSQTDRINPSPPTWVPSGGSTLGMQAIQIEIRLYDQDADRIRQQTIIESY